MINEEARAYFIDSNERIISAAKDENRYNYETQEIEDVFMRRDFEAKELAIKALKQEPILDKINKMKSEIASSLEFWDYSPNNNPLARDILETVTHFWGDIRGVEE